MAASSMSSTLPYTPQLHIENIVDRRAGYGILVLTPFLELLYRDRRAIYLCEQLNIAHKGNTHDRWVPLEVTKLCLEILQTLKFRTTPKDWEQFQVKRLLSGPERPVLLYGVGLPHADGMSKTLILILMDEIIPRHEKAIESAKEIFGFTNREVNVIENLMKGWSNQEIAEELGVTRQTVIEHIKHIMKKTQIRTRAGIITQILGGPRIEYANQA